MRLSDIIHKDDIVTYGLSTRCELRVLEIPGPNGGTITYTNYECRDGLRDSESERRSHLRAERKSEAFPNIASLFECLNQAFRIIVSPPQWQHCVV